MRQFLSRSIVAFAKLVTLPLADARAKDSIARALDALKVEPARVDMERGSMLFDAGTATCARMAVMFPRYEPDTLEWLDAMPDDACLWDIGGHVGVFSVYAALAPRRRVVAFEPAARTFAVLMRNIELNRMEDRIAAYCIALAQETKLDTLNMATTEPGRAAGIARIWHRNDPTRQFDRRKLSPARGGLCHRRLREDFRAALAQPRQDGRGQYRGGDPAGRSRNALRAMRLYR